MQPQTADAPADADREAIQQLLDLRSAALLAGDREAFLASVAPGQRQFRRRQALLFDGWADVPLESYQLVARWDRLGDLALRDDVRAYPRADALTIPLTEERYRIRGYDREDAVENMFFTFVRHDGQWFIADDADVSEMALFSGRHLWDFGPLVKRESDHFLLLASGCAGGRRSGLCDRTKELLQLSEEALEQVDRLWELPWHHKVVLLLPASEDELARMIQATFDLDNFVAFAYSSVDSTRRLDFTGHRVILNPDAFRDRSSESARTILTHELLHIATRDVSGPFVPSFVEEGIADYVGYDDPGSLSFLEGEVAAGTFDESLPLDFEFTSGEATSIFRSYQESQSAIRFLVDRWGTPALERFYRTLGDVSVAPGTARFHVDRALRAAIGVGYEQFERRWASSLRAP